jgi:hypothetical protein
MAPGMHQPIVRSLADLASRTDVRLLVDKGKAADVFLTVIITIFEKSLPQVMM